MDALYRTFFSGLVPPETPRRHCDTMNWKVIVATAIKMKPNFWNPITHGITITDTNIPYSLTTVFANGITHSWHKFVPPMSWWTQGKRFIAQWPSPLLSTTLTSSLVRGLMYAMHANSRQTTQGGAANTILQIPPVIYQDSGILTKICGNENSHCQLLFKVGANCVLHCVPSVWDNLFVADPDKSVQIPHLIYKGLLLQMPYRQTHADLIKDLWGHGIADCGFNTISSCRSHGGFVRAKFAPTCSYNSSMGPVMACLLDNCHLWVYLHKIITSIYKKKTCW